jgi:arginase
MPGGLLLNWFKKKVHGFEWIQDYLQDPLPENRIAYIGLRDVDEREKALLRQSNMHVYSMIDVDRIGIAGVMEEIIEKLTPESDPRPVHLSFDIDGIDPQFAPGTGTRAKGGLNYREARYICTKLAETGRLESMDLVEVNPDIDIEEKLMEHGDNPCVDATASMTVKLGIDLIEFALGKTLV